jgi:proteasome lid subunit RPN8/RPN11
MKKIPSRSVIFDESIYKRIVKRAFKSFPNENGGFLMTLSTVDNEIYPVVDVYHSRTAEGDRTSWGFTNECVVKANMAASKKGLVVCGIYHSHPWSIVPPGLVYQSHQDAELQKAYNIPLSMIIGITNGRFITSIWKHDFPSPYIQIIDPSAKKAEVTYLGEWYRKKKEDPFWSLHFGTLPKMERFGK